MNDQADVATGDVFDASDQLPAPPPSPGWPQQRAVPVPANYRPQLALAPHEAKALAESVERIKREVMRPGVDYDTIPGTPKPALLKPGAERLQQMFGLGVTMQRSATDLVDRWRGTIIDKSTGEEIQVEPRSKTPGVSLGYLARVTRTLPNGMVVTVAECEGFAGNDEQKWRDSDRNTIAKMAQKRAHVGAVLLATGSSGLFEQDLDDSPAGDAVRTRATEDEKAREKFRWPFKGDDSGKPLHEVSGDSLRWFVEQYQNRNPKYADSDAARKRWCREEIDRRLRETKAGAEAAAAADLAPDTDGLPDDGDDLTPETRSELVETLVRHGYNKSIADAEARLARSEEQGRMRESWAREQIENIQRKAEAAAGEPQP